MSVVLTADCDLEQDYNARTADPDESNPRVLAHALLFDLYAPSEIRPRTPGTDLWKRVRQNEDQRYHTVPAADIGSPPLGQLEEMCIDFRKGVGIPVAQIYEALRLGLVTRVAIIPDVWVHQIMQRCYGYLGRVGLPD
jgi:hypothetical protein